MWIFAGDADPRTDRERFTKRSEGVKVLAMLKHRIEDDPLQDPVTSSGKRMRLYNSRVERRPDIRRIPRMGRVGNGRAAEKVDMECGSIQTRTKRWRHKFKEGCGVDDGG